MLTFLHTYILQNKPKILRFQPKIMDRSKNKPIYPVNLVNPVKKIKLPNKANLNMSLIYLLSQTEKFIYIPPVIPYYNVFSGMML